MPNVSKRLKVYKTKHETLGELIELYSPCELDGSSAYWIEEDAVQQRDYINGGYKDVFIERGMGLRLTKKTALALGQALIKLAKGKK